MRELDDIGERRCGDQCIELIQQVVDVRVGHGFGDGQRDRHGISIVHDDFERRIGSDQSVRNSSSQLARKYQDVARRRRAEAIRQNLGRLEYAANRLIRKRNRYVEKI